MDFNIIQGQSVLTGTDAYSGTLSLGVTVLVDKGIYLCQVPNANTITNPTLNINAIGAKTIFDITGNALHIGALQSGMYAFFMWDASIPGFRFMCCKEVDTGWVDLAGFSFMPAGTRPQYRVIGRTLQFRGSLVVPLSSDNGTTLIPYTGEPDYVTQDFVIPYQGSAATGGVLINPAGSITFNQNVSVIPVQYFPDNTYQIHFRIISRRINSDDPTIAITYTATVTLVINTSGKLLIGTLYDIEELYATQDVGFSPLRFINSNVANQQYALDFKKVTQSSPVLTNILSSTNTSPIVLTVGAVPSNIVANSIVSVVGHLVNTGANGTWTVSAVTGTDITLKNSTGTGIGGATGTVTPTSATGSNPPYTTLFGTFTNLPLPETIVPQAVKHQVTMDAAIPSNLGGFNIVLDGLIAYLSP